jgi:hypothetical protein
MNAGFGFLEVKCLGRETHLSVDLTTLRRPKATPVTNSDAACGVASVRRLAASPTSEAV